MGLLVAVLLLALVALVFVVVGAPLRRARRGEQDAGPAQAPTAEAAADAAALARRRLRAEGEREDLEAAREAKYREIRDAELDYRTGKLSREDYEAIDSDLRSEAIAILDRIERARDTHAGASGSRPGDAPARGGDGSGAPANGASADPG